MAQDQSGHTPSDEGANPATSDTSDSSVQGVVRLAKTDIDGTKQVAEALQDVYGVGVNYAHAIASTLDIDHATKLGALSEDELDEVETCIQEPEEFDIPSYLYNRRRDPETGENKHLVEADLDLAQEMDVRRLKDIESYKGWRHELGLPVRGQNTRTSFRGESSVGVRRARVQQEAAEEEAAEEEGESGGDE